MAMVRSQQNVAKAIINLFGPKMELIKHFEGVKKNNKEIYIRKQRLLKGQYESQNLNFCFKL